MRKAGRARRGLLPERNDGLGSESYKVDGKRDTHVPYALWIVVITVDGKDWKSDVHVLILVIDLWETEGGGFRRRSPFIPREIHFACLYPVLRPTPASLMSSMEMGR